MTNFYPVGYDLICREKLDGSKTYAVSASGLLLKRSWWTKKSWWTHAEPCYVYTLYGSNDIRTRSDPYWMTKTRAELILAYVKDHGLENI